jgi:uncharacterized protein (TIGR00661 family)
MVRGRKVMAKIIYGVSGEGSGHSSRAKEIAAHLVMTGHQVKIVSYDRGYKNLKNDFEVFETEGLHIASVDNKVSIVKTFTDNFKKLSHGQKKFKSLKKLFQEFQPDCVITDFEPMTAYLAAHYKLPLISIDNQHRMRYMKYPCPPKHKKDQLITEAVIRAMVPKPDVALVTSFYFGEVKNNKTFIFPPILRKEVLEQKTSSGEHILVYFTSGFESFLDILKEFPRETFKIYGYDKSEIVENFVFQPFSKQGFLKDLASAKAVIATAGFTLMTESLFLRKPYLALPMAGQFEQELNGFLLDGLKYGANCPDISKEAVASFLYHLPDYRENLKGYRAEDNKAIKAKIDELLKDK